MRQSILSYFILLDFLSFGFCFAQSKLLGHTFLPAPELITGLPDTFSITPEVMSIQASLLKVMAKDTAVENLATPCSNKGEFIYWGILGPEILELPNLVRSQLEGLGFPYTDIDSGVYEDNSYSTFYITTTTKPIVGITGVYQAKDALLVDPTFPVSETDTTSKIAFMVWC
jgi:hypothetical protein